jgi:thymidylate synthase (FAD)
MYEEGTPEYESWLRAQLACEKEYLFQVNDLGRSPQEARSCLPNSLKTSVSMNTNIREWLSIILSNTHSSSRTQKAAHPQMRQVMHPLALFLKAEYPILFGKVGFEETIDPKYYARVFKHAFDE